jgi:hypothetical protein
MTIESTTVTLQLSESGPHHPLLREATLACGGRGGRTQFRRLDRHSGTLYSHPFMNEKKVQLHADMETETHSRKNSIDTHVCTLALGCLV